MRSQMPRARNVPNTRGQPKGGALATETLRRSNTVRRLAGRRPLGRAGLKEEEHCYPKW